MRLALAGLTVAPTPGWLLCESDISHFRLPIRLSVGHFERALRQYKGLRVNE